MMALFFLVSGLSHPLTPWRSTTKGTTPGTRMTPTTTRSRTHTAATRSNERQEVEMQVMLFGY
jgi:hypothetical protein